MIRFLRFVTTLKKIEILKIREDKKCKYDQLITTDETKSVLMEDLGVVFTSPLKSNPAKRCAHWYGLPRSLDLPFP
jgi:hypothetical protein